MVGRRLFCLFAGLSFYGESVTAQTFIDYPGATSTVPQAVNSQGTVVGWYSSSNGTHGFQWSGGNNYQTIDYPGAGATRIYGVSTNGDIVGSYSDASGLKGFIRRGGTFTSVSFGSIETQLTGLNSQGKAVGFFKDNFGDSHGFVLDGVDMTELPQAPGARQVSTVPSGINDNGAIAGTFGVQFGPPNNSGFVLGPGGFTVINVPGAFYTFVTGINNAGHLVGYSSPDFASQPAFVLKHGVFSPVPIQDATLVVPTGINSTGIVVGYYNTPADENLHGFVLTTGCSAPTSSLKQYSAPWNDDPYDHLPGKTVQQKGCGTTSLAMIMSYYGYSITPGDLNTFLVNYYNDSNSNGQLDPGEPTYGYDRRGRVIWPAVSALTLGNVQYKGFATGTTALDGELCSQRPAILRVPGHFVVATEKLATTYKLNDPGHNIGQLDNSRYSNTFQSIRRFGPPGSGLIDVRTDPNVEMLITDSQGQAAGRLNGTTVTQIPNSSVDEESIDDLDVPNSDQPALIVFIQKPTPGLYQLRVKAATNTNTVIDIRRYDGDDRPQSLISIPLTLIGGVETVVSFNYSALPGDLNGDGKVDAQDLAVVRASVGKKAGIAGFNPIADVTRDGVVDVRDLAFVSRNVK